MALSDPQSITVAGSAKSMPNVTRGNFQATYQTSDENWLLSVSHQKIGSKTDQRIKTTVRFSQRKVVVDPLSSENDYGFNNWTISNERPIVGFTATEVADQITGLKTWLDATMIGKLFGQES